MGVLINSSDYNTIEKEREKFLDYAKKLPQNMLWQQAWNKYFFNKVNKQNK